MNRELQFAIYLEKIKKEGVISVRVKGKSMEPTLVQGDFVRVEKKDQYSLGDVIVFKYHLGDLIIHRIVDIQDKSYFCKGDNAFSYEKIFPPQIMGKVIECSRPTALEWPIELVNLSRDVMIAFEKTSNDGSVATQKKVYAQYKKFLMQWYLDKGLLG